MEWGFLDGTWEEACCRYTKVYNDMNGEGWTTKHVGELGEPTEEKNGGAK